MFPASHGRNPAHAILLCCLIIAAALPSHAQPDDSVQKAIEHGKLYESKHQWDLAYEAFREADKLSHHSSTEALLHIALIEKRAGLLPEAAYDAKKAASAAGADKATEVRARLLRAALLSAMSNKPSDGKLKDAEAELRAVVALDPQQPIAHFNLGMVLIKQERDNEGVAELKAFVAMPNADHETVAEAQKTIANPIRARTPFVPEFSFTTLENQQVSNASLRGKVALIDFWGTWCPPCRESVPILKNIQKKYSSKPFQLVGISSDDDEDMWKTFISAQRMDWSEYLDSSGELLHKFKVDSFPTYVVVDKDGVIRFRQSGLGPETQMELEDAINKALKKDSNPALAKIAAASDLPQADSIDSQGQQGARLANGSTPSRALSTDPSDSGAAPTRLRHPANYFHDSRLAMTYLFPDGWQKASAESLRAVNERVQQDLRTALVMQSAQDADQVQLIPPTYIFYASPRGDGSPERPSLPAICMRIESTRLDQVDQLQFRQLMEKMAATTGLKALAPTSAFEVKGQKFARADFDRNAGALHYFVSYVQTVANGSLLHVDITAESLEQLNKIAGTLQTCEFDESE